MFVLMLRLGILRGLKRSERPADGAASKIMKPADGSSATRVGYLLV